MDQAAPTSREITAGAQVAPVPAWVDLEPYHIPETANPHFVSNGLCVLLDDSQIDLCGPERAWYYRRADMVTASVGAERAAQFSVSFDPSYERVDVHAITVIRAGRRIEHAPTAFFEVLRRERHMERMQFDGRLTLHVTLPDVRQGDVVETSYTLYGQRRSLRGRHAALIQMEWSVGIVDVRLRQRTPSSREIAERTFNSAPEALQSENDGIVDRRWRLLERPGVRYEPMAPPWLLQSAAVQFSEWCDWGEVASVFTPLYDEPGPLPPLFAQEVERIATEEQSAPGRAMALLRFTQDAVRYLTVSIGDAGHTPRSLTDVEATRYGDCKDKSKLYTYMAHALGLNACPALVHTRDSYALSDWLPTGIAFDHCIVRLEIDGTVYWLDPTRPIQHGAIDNITQCYYGWALPLRPGQSELEKMPESPVRHLVETKEYVNLGISPSAPVTYVWEHTYRGTRAENVRARRERDGEVGMFKSYAEDVKRNWPKARVVKQEIVKDDTAINEITVRESYEIEEAWKHVSGSTYTFTTFDLTLHGALNKLDPGERKHPIYLAQSGKRTRRVGVQSTTAITGNWSREIVGSTLRFSDTAKREGTSYLAIDQALEISDLCLPAEEADTYRKIQGELGTELTVTENLSNGAFGPTEDDADVTSMRPVAFWFVIAVCLAGIAFLVWALAHAPVPPKP